jgi:hypothetical protein
VCDIKYYKPEEEVDLTNGGVLFHGGLKKKEKNPFDEGKKEDNKANPKELKISMMRSKTMDKSNDKIKSMNASQKMRQSLTVEMQTKVLKKKATIKDLGKNITKTLENLKTGGDLLQTDAEITENTFIKPRQT